MRFQPSEQMRKAGWSFSFCHSKATLVCHSWSRARPVELESCRCFWDLILGKILWNVTGSNSSILGWSL